MSQIFPTYSPPDANITERKLRRYFESLPDDWLVFHGQKITIPSLDKKEEEVEIDFLVINPGLGYVCFEVKGGQVSKDQRGWLQNGKMMKRDPVVQSKRARSILQKYLRSKEWPWEKCCSWGLIFPDVSTEKVNFGSDLPENHVIDSQQLPFIQEKVNVLLRTRKFHKPSDSMTEDDLHLIKETLYPVFDLKPGLVDKLSDEQAVFIRLTEEQKRIMISHSEQKKVFFEGMAGTGKTIIAKALAEEKAAQGLKVLYLCFNEELASSMKYNLQDVDVFYFHQLSRDVCEKADIEWQIPTDYKEKEDFYNIYCNDLLLEALEKLPEQRWDVVVVDEAHDLKEDWWLSVHELLKDKKKSYLWAFIDPLQDIFSRKSLEQFSLRPAPLFFNCRNTKEIAEYSYGWVDDKPHMHPESPQGEKVEDIIYKDNHEQLDKLSNLLQELLVDQKV